MMITPSIRLQNHDNALSHQDLEHIAKGLGKASESGNSWKCLCPAHNDHNPSLSISLGNDGKLLLYCHTGCSFEEIIKEIKDRGLLLSNQSNASRFCEPKAANPVRHEKTSTIPLEYVKKLWAQSQPSARTLVERYLRSRGIVAEIPSSLRFLKSHLHTKSQTKWPCMLGKVERWPSDELIALHRTFLKHDGSGKAPIDSEKMMLRQVTGGAVRFGDCLEVIATAEGIETALSYWQETGVTTWAVLSRSGFNNVVLPPVEITKEVILLADHDSSGLKAAKAAVKRFRQEGRKVYFIIPQEEGQDFNDLLNGGVK